MVDYLLSIEGLGGFTSYDVKGHGGEAELTVAEQVSGRRRRVQFEVLMEPEKVDRVLNGLESEVGKDITCWQVPATGLYRT